MKRTTRAPREDSEVSGDSSEPEECSDVEIEDDEPASEAESEVQEVVEIKNDLGGLTEVTEKLDHN